MAHYSPYPASGLYQDINTVAGQIRKKFPDEKILSGFKAEITRFQGEIAHHRGSVHGYAKISLHNLLLRVIENTLKEFPSSYIETELLRFGPIVLLTTLGLTLYLGSQLDERVSKLATPDKLANSVRSLFGQTVKTEPTTMRMAHGLQQALTEFVNNLYGAENVVRLQESFKQLHAARPPLSIDSFRTFPLDKHILDGVVADWQAKVLIPFYRDAVNPNFSLALDLNKICAQKKPESFRMAFVGCHGMDATAASRFMVEKHEGNEQAQGAVAAEMRAQNCDLHAQGGDNAYCDGLPYSVDEGDHDFFARNQEHYGLRDTLEPICNIVALGNHDYGVWSNSDVTEIFKPETKVTDNLQRALHQAWHTFLQPGYWHMLYRYYVVMHAHFAYIVLDTNTIIFDGMQQMWFVQTVQKLRREYPRIWIIVMAHHPLVYIGKRANEECEWDKYLEKARGWGRPGLEAIKYMGASRFEKFSEMSKQKGAFHEFNNIGKFLLWLIATHDLLIDLWLAAHEHLLAVINVMVKARNIKQITSGGGGAHLNPLVIDPNQYPIIPPECADPASQGVLLANNVLASVSSPFYASLHGFFELEIKQHEISYQPHVLFRKQDSNYSNKFAANKLPKDKHGVKQHFGVDLGDPVSCKWRGGMQPLLQRV